MTATLPLFQQERERRHDNVGRHKANESRVSKGVDTFIREYMQKAVAHAQSTSGNRYAWSKWFRPEKREGHHSMSQWILDTHGAHAAPDTCRRRMLAICKSDGYEYENINSTGLYRIRVK